MRPLHLTPVLLLLLAGCNTPRVGKIRIEKAPLMVEIAPAPDTLRFSDLFQRCDLLELKGALLSEIDDVQQTDEFLIVRSKSGGKDLHVFDRRGRFIRSLVSYGRAGNEVLDIQACCYNEYLNTVDVLCNYGTQIKQYPVNGAPCTTVPLPEKSILAAKDLEVMDGSTYLLYKDIGYLDVPEYKLYVYDYKADTVVGRFIPLDKETEEKISFGQKNNLYRQEGRVYLYEVFQNGIFEVRPDGVRPSVAFTKNAYSFPSHLLTTSRDVMDLIARCKSHNYIWAHVNCIRHRHCIFSFFTYSAKVYGNFIDLDRRKAQSFLYVEDDLLSRTTVPATMWNVIGSTPEGLICNFRENDHLPEEPNYLLFLRNPACGQPVAE